MTPKQCEVASQVRVGVIPHNARVASRGSLDSRAMRCVLGDRGRSLVGSLVLAAALWAGAGAARAATDPAPPAAPAVAYTLPGKNPADWVVSGDGSKLAIGTWTYVKLTKEYTATITLVDLRTGAATTMDVPDSQYYPPDPGLSNDGRFLSWTTATIRGRKGKALLWTPTTWVRDLTTGQDRAFKNFDGNVGGGDGTFMYGYQGPTKRWGDPGVGEEQPKAEGVLQLAAGRFVPLPGRVTRRSRHTDVTLTPTGKAAYVYRNRCWSLDALSGVAHRLGACDDATTLAISNDGSTVFADELGGWIDATTGAKRDGTFDAKSYVKATTRSWVMTSLTGDLSKLLVVCFPGTNPKKDDLAKKPRRAYVLDRASGLYAPFAGPTGPISANDRFTTNFVAPTLDGDEVLWDIGSQIWRGSTTPTGPAGPLPAECQPA